MKPQRSIVGLIPMLFLALFFVWPVATLLWRGLASDPGRLVEVASTGRFQRVLWFTTWQAVLSTALTLVAAWPLTWLLANRRFRGRELARVLTTVPFVLPTVVVAGAFVAVSERFGLDDGAVRFRHTVWAVLAAHVFFNIAVVVRTVGTTWSRLDRRPEEAARTLGASPLRTFLLVTLPRLRPAILAAASIVLLFTFTSFAIVLILGGPRRSTLETEIYRFAVTRSDITTAAALSVMQMVVVVGLVAVSARTERIVARQRLVIDRAVPIRGGADRARAAAALCWSVLVLGIPPLVLLERSLRSGGSWSLDHYRSLSEPVRLLPITPAEALVNSLGFAVVAAGIAAVVAGPASLAIVHGRRWLSRVLDLGALIPLGTSAVTLGFGVLITLDRGLFDLRGTWFIIPLTQSLIAIPFIIRTVVPVLRAIDPRMRDAAATLGAPPGRVRREIDLRLGGRALATGLGFAFAVSLGEFGATSFVGRSPDLMTVPLAIERLLGTPGELLRGQAMALSVILMVVTAVVVLAVDRVHLGAASRPLPSPTPRVGR